jgi:hypothetical protein
MSVLADWECAAHGVFEARTKTSGKAPRCPKGCSAALVTMVFLKAPRIGNERYKRGDKLVKEMAEMQGLSDISDSPSRPGGTVAQRNRAKMLGPKGRQYPEAVAATPVDFGKYLGAMTMQDNALTRTGFGHPYDAKEWKTDKETGQVKHTGAQGPIVPVPTGSTGVSIERVKEAPK